MYVVGWRGGVEDWFESDCRVFLEVPFPENVFPRGAGEEERPFWAALGACGDFGAAVSFPFPLAVSPALSLALWRSASLWAACAEAGLPVVKLLEL